MRFGGEVHDVVRAPLVEKLHHRFRVADVSANEHVALVALQLLEVFKIACVGQLVDVYYADVVMLSHHVEHEIRADESGSAGNKVGCGHASSPFGMFALFVRVGF